MHERIQAMPFLIENGIEGFQQMVPFVRYQLIHDFIVFSSRQHKFTSFPDKILPHAGEGGNQKKEEENL